MPECSLSSAIPNYFEVVLTITHSSPNEFNPFSTGICVKQRENESLTDFSFRFYLGWLLIIGVVKQKELDIRDSLSSNTGIA